jgi:hypothetical protein
MLFLNRFPPVSWIDYHLVKFIGFPFFVAWFFTQKTLDGKSPHRFIYRYIEYSLSPRVFSRYAKIKRSRGLKSYEGEVGYRLS